MSNLFKKPSEKTSAKVQTRAKSTESTDNPLLSKIPESMRATMQFIENNNALAEQQKSTSREKEFEHGRSLHDSFLEQIDNFRLTKTT